MKRLLRANGFTLVEVLAALVLAGIVLPVALRGISLATLAARDACMRREATELAQAQLADLVTSGSWQTGELSGDFGADWPEYAWEAEVADWNGMAGISQLTVWVTWTERMRPREVVLDTLVSTAAPEATGPGGPGEPGA